jgi:hypothetical protein
MQAQDTAGSPAEQDAQIDGAVLGLLLDSRHPLSVVEVAREIKDEIAATDAVNRLTGAGLAHRSGAFVFPTRAAVRACDLTSL